MLGSLKRWAGRIITPRDGSFWSEFYGGANYSGKTVTADSAMTLSTFWSCVRLLAETVATLPLPIYQKTGPDERDEYPKHFLYPILHDQPNIDHDSTEYIEGLVTNLCTWGNHYAEKTETRGELRALTALSPDAMSVRRDENGALRYDFTDRGKLEKFPREKIFHVRGFGAGLDVGLSPVSYARESLGLAMTSEELTARLQAGGVRPTGFLTVDQVLKKVQRDQVKKNIVEPYVGSEKAGGVMVLEAGMKFQPVTMNPVDAEMLANRQFNVEDICRWFRIPPFMVGHTSTSTSWGTGLEQQMLGFLTFALRPYLTRIEKAVKRQLIPAAERSTVYAEFNLEGLLRADSAARAALYSTFAQNGIATRNQLRRRENMPPEKGGDILTVQSNLIPLARMADPNYQATQTIPEAAPKKEAA